MSKDTTDTPKSLKRYEDLTRMNHWAIVFLFFGAGLSGLAFFHPSLFFLTDLFGGGPWTRILHPYLGVLMALAFVGMYVELWRDNLLVKVDVEWLKKMGEMFAGRKENMPEVGKYNAGQKIVFWLMTASLLTLILTGILFWHTWFPHFPILARRIGVLIHAFSATVLILTVITHIYAAIWVKGTTRAMTEGSVSRSWAKANHPLWYKEKIAEENSTNTNPT
jgi:formate dehydrogenase subunit gamma